MRRRCRPRARGIFVGCFPPGAAALERGNISGVFQACEQKRSMFSYFFPGFRRSKYDLYIYLCSGIRRVQEKHRVPRKTKGERIFFAGIFGAKRRENFGGSFPARSAGNSFLGVCFPPGCCRKLRKNDFCS